MRPLLVLVVLALLAAPSLAAVKRPRNDGAADANPMPQKAGKGDDDESPHDFLDVESRGDCESCANRGAVDPSPADDSFLQLSATSQSGTHTRARRAVFSASALNELLLHNSAQHRVTLGAKAMAVINSFRNLAKTAAGAAGMPNLHYLRLWLGQAAVVGANTAAAFKDPKPYAYAAAAPVLPAAPAWGAATTALHFPQGAHTVTHRNWVYTLDVYGRITQVTGAVRSNAIAGGTAPKGVTRDFVNAIADVNAAAAGWHAGHVRAAAFGGNFDILNFVPEAANVNTGIQCRIESLLVEMTAGIAGPHNLHSTLTITYTYPAFGAAPNAAFYRPSTIQVHAVPLAGAPAAAAGWVQAAGQTIDITFPNA